MKIVTLNNSELRIKLKKEFYLNTLPNVTENFFSLNSQSYYYLYSFFLKKNFIKTTTKPKKLTIKNSHNISFFLNSCFKRGMKLKMLRFLNIVRFNFYFFFTKKSNFFIKKFPTYNIFYNFSRTEKRFFDFNFLLDLIYKNNETIFSTKAIKLNKKLKQKSKTKLKYSVDVQYLKSEKRFFFVMKQIHLLANNFNFYNYNERLLVSFLNAFFLEKNSDMYRNKLMTYKSILKKNSK